MRPRAGTRPSGALPALHPHQFRAGIQLHNAIYLAVGVTVVLALENGIAIHVDCCDAHVARGGGGECDLRAAVVGAWGFGGLGI